MAAVSCSMANWEKMPSSVGSDMSARSCCDGIVGHHAAFVQDHDARADPLDGLEFVRAEEDHFPAGGEFAG